MNSSPITCQAEYDYRFIKYLMDDVFTKETLAQSAVYQSHDTRKRKFHTLNEDKISFVQDVLKERIKNDKKRLEEISKHINKRCTAWG